MVMFTVPVRAVLRNLDPWDNNMRNTDNDRGSYNCYPKFMNTKLIMGVALQSVTG